MAITNKRGATRKHKPKVRQPVSWHQWMRSLMLALAVILMLSAAVYLHQDDTLPILNVSVEGDFIYANKDELVKAVKPFVTGNFINVNVAKIRQAGEALPWVRQVQVRRVWPDSLHLIVEEQIAVARWGNEQLVNEKGEIFQPPRVSIPTDLVKLQGLQGSNVVMTKRLLDIQQQVAALGLETEKITMDQRRAWTIYFDNKIQLVLGRANSEQRLQRFVNVFEAGLQRFQADISVVDMRYPNGLSVRWKAGQKPNFIGTV
jgi:cell division protein FtsQ